MVGKSEKFENDDALLLRWRVVANSMMRQDGEGPVSLSFVHGFASGVSIVCTGEGFVWV
jgi:hypothetical protein